MPTWNDFKKEIKLHEGCISHMYLDTVGKVTVGVGNMLPSVSEAQRLAFAVRGSNSAATRDEIKTDFDAVAKRPTGQIASSYKSYTKLDLPTHVIDTLLEQRIDGFKRDLRQRFSKFDSFPITAQFALTDMAFNLGSNGLSTKFPKFCKAIEVEDWKTAASESNRPQVATSRNQAVKKWLEEADTRSTTSSAVTITFSHGGNVPMETQGKTKTVNSLYESSVTLSSPNLTLRGSIYPDDMDIKGRLVDGTYDVHLGFHKRSGTPKQEDLEVRTQNFRAALIVNLDKDVSVTSNSTAKKTSNAIHIHNGFNSKRYSEGCLTLHPDDWSSFIKIFLQASPKLSDWTSTSTYVGKKIGSLIIKS
jgi:GH24 family phage-related lysozyme (muramidase)